MCGRYELKTQFEKLPLILKENLPKSFEKNYSQQELIRPNDPVLVLRDEGKVSSCFMLWGFISEWAKDPFDPSKPKPFNARVETVKEKKLFRGSWRYKRCLLPASGFFEKGHRISRKDYQPFWLAGIWNRWMSPEGSELETCCILTTNPNTLMKQLHNRMPVIIPNGLEKDWIAPNKNVAELRRLESLINGWSPEEWIATPIQDKPTFQLSLF
ncbi:SOS response-associated peptidase [Prochlorococcus sp. MIT 1341]|uniref:SOS response-associated peptidase n=1 Tax=Prochlorococcus sp. MIT 1341 TaxID=3096221 RepID=UPI002A75C82B|nr:SOS response-associated peptidase [Prochlorococcus sp. MIT 1341]